MPWVTRGVALVTRGVAWVPRGVASECGMAGLAINIYLCFLTLSALLEKAGLWWF